MSERPNRVLVPIHLDKPRTLRLNLKAAILIKEHTGLDMFNPPTNFEERVNSSDFFEVFVWACALHEDKTLSRDMVGDEVDAAFIAAHPALVGRVMAASRGVAVEVPHERPLPESPSSGLTSGPSAEPVST